MGLDMYLEGKKFLWTDWEHPERNQKQDGFRVREIVLELGYWRKHPNLHGYIVERFAEGRDECQNIHLEEKDLMQIKHAVESDELPHTKGFFFGASTDQDKKPTLEIIDKALEWLRQDEKKISRSVVYRASW